MAISTLKDAMDFTLLLSTPQLYAENVGFGAAISELAVPGFGRVRPPWRPTGVMAVLTVTYSRKAKQISPQSPL